MSKTITKTTKHEDLSRQFMIDCTADGSVFMRLRTAPLPKGRLPLFSVNTFAEGNKLIQRFARRARNRSGNYRLNDFPTDDVDALDRFAAMFREAYARILAGDEGDENQLEASR